MEAIDIETQLKTSFPSIEACTKLKSRNGTQSSSFLLTTSKDINLGKLKQIEDIDNVRVKWEPFHKKLRVTQCHNCQNFGHGSSSCQLKSRCVKCTKNHHTRDCPSKREDNQVQCCNCHGPHPANYRKCPAYERYVDSRNKTQKAPNTTPTRTFAHQNTDTRTFAQATANIMPAHTTPPNTHTHTANSQQSKQYTATHTHSSNQHENDTHTFSTLLQELNTLNSICNLKEMLMLVRQLNAKLTPNMSPIEKLMVIQEVTNGY